MKDHLIFDVTDAGTIADTDSVGAFVRAGTDGTLIGFQNLAAQDWLNVASVLYDETGTPISGANPLDVNVTNTIAVSLDGVYDGVTNTDPDNVGVIFHTRNAAPGDAQQTQRTTAAAPGTLASASLATAKAIDSNAFMYALDDVNGDAELLSKDNVSNGLNVHIAGMDGTLTVSDAALANTSMAHAAKTLGVADTSENIITSPLANRKYVWVYNYDNSRVFIGGTGVDAATGFPLSPGSMMEFRAGAAVDIEFVGQSGKTPQIRTLQLN